MDRVRGLVACFCDRKTLTALHTKPFSGNRNQNQKKIMEIQGVKRKHDETESSLPESDKPQDSSKPQDPPESKPQDQNQASPEKQPNNSDPKPETTTLVDRLHAEWFVVF